MMNVLMAWLGINVLAVMLAMWRTRHRRMDAEGRVTLHRGGRDMSSNTGLGTLSSTLPASLLSGLAGEVN